MNSIRTELAAAVRKVAAAYRQTPEAIRPEVDTARWRELEAEIDSLIAKGDRESALLAIEQWQAFALGELQRAADESTVRPFAAVT